ncbi:MAG: ATPase, T2SS/T4P/T4SS family [Symbiopectobacterium sp.]
MGQLDIAEHRLPQDGQFSFALNAQSLSLCIATLPVLEGKKNRTARITNLPTYAHSR